MAFSISPIRITSYNVCYTKLLRVDVAADASEEAILDAAKADGKVAAHLDGKTILKSIYVPKKLVNFVVK